MMDQQFVQNLKELDERVNLAMKENRSVFVYFSGTTDLNSGDSWSVDCRNSEPVLEKLMKGTRKEDLFLMVEVGSETEWNDPKNPFREHSTYKLTAIPSLLLIESSNGTPTVQKRLECKACLDSQAVENLFQHK